MLQTNSAGSLLAGAAVEQSPSKAGTHADDSGAFSQEFEKQVKKAGQPASGQANGDAERHQAEKPRQRAEGAEAKNDASETRAKASTEEGADAAEEAMPAESEAAMDGKTLPQALADLASDEASERRIEHEPEQGALAETPLPLNQTAGERRSEVIADVLKGQKTDVVDGRQQAAGPMPKPDVSAQLAEETPAEDGLEPGILRLRDVMAQRMLAGNGQGDAGGAGRQGKADMGVLLPAQSAVARPVAGFDEALRLSSVTGMPATPLNQPAAASVPVAMTLAVPMQQPGWDQAMGERVVWMARSNLQHAEIQLNPRELGPIEIKISMQKDQTHVNFVAHHATTRDALEAAIPRLREMLSEQGLNLGQADVSQHSFGDSGKQASQTNGGNALPGSQGLESEEELSDETLVTRHVGHVSPSGVDYFA